MTIKEESHEFFKYSFVLLKNGVSIFLMLVTTLNVESLNVYAIACGLEFAKTTMNGMADDIVLFGKGEHLVCPCVLGKG